MISLICGINLKIQQNSVHVTKNTQTHRYREQTSGYQWGEGRGWGNLRVEDKKAQPIRYKKNYKDILYNTRYIANIL